MTNITDEMIREAAYYLWENAGKPSGNGAEFWNKACAQIYGIHKMPNDSMECVSQKSNMVKSSCSDAHKTVIQPCSQIKKTL